MALEDFIYKGLFYLNFQSFSKKYIF